MHYLLILNDPAYGTERSYNGFRLARGLASQEGAEVRVFLMGDAVTCALAGQKTPNGYYNLERMLHSAVAKGVQVGCCGSCLDARGMTDDRITEGARRSSLEELTEWTVSAEKVISF